MASLERQPASNLPNPSQDADIEKRFPPSLSPEALNIARSLEQRREDEALSMQDPYFSFLTEAERRKDENYVEDMRRRHTTKATSRERDLASVASAFEYVVYKRINDTGWLGDSMRAELTTHYDDYRHGIDLYVERIDVADSKPLGLSVDLTFSGKESEIRRKIESIKNFHLDRGRLAELRYHRPISEEARKSSHEERTASLVKLPKVIVGVTRKRALDALERFAGENPDERDTGTGLIMLYQIERQLAAYARYSRALYRKRKLASLEDAAASYENTLKDVHALTDRKLASLQIDRSIVTGFALQDPVTQLIIQELDTLLDSMNA